MRRFLLAVAISVAIIVATASSAFAASQPSTPTFSTGAPIAPGTVIHATSCDQAPPQSVKDRAMYTPAELAHYGLPQRATGEPFDKWARVVRSSGKRFCDRTVTNIRNTTDVQSTNWAGNIADEGCCNYPDSYTEADVEFHVPCISGQTDSYASFWVGLGGWSSNENLVQTGVAAHRVYVANSGWYTVYHAWVENLGYAPNPYENDLTNFSLGCGDLIFAQVYGGNCMYIQDFATGSNSGNVCYGPNASTHTAEAIAERPDIGGTQQPLANFGSVTFLGTGITDNGSYYGMSQVTHDYTNLYSPDKSHILASVGAIFYDSNQNPPYDYTVTWQRYT